MGNEPATASTARRPLPAAQVYGMAIFCLLMGLAIGYQVSGRFKGSSSPAPAAPPVATVKTPSAPGSAMAGAHMPGMAEMKQMADRQAGPLLEKLKSDPNNSGLLLQVGAIYHASHQFKEAAEYYRKAVQADPTNVATRNRLASSLYRYGEVDAAIAELNRALTYDPNDANSLFNLGMIRLQGKGDGKGAVAAWQQLLKSNPHLSADRKAEVQKLMADVLTTLGDQHGIEGARKQ